MNAFSKVNLCKWIFISIFATLALGGCGNDDKKPTPKPDQINSILGGFFDLFGHKNQNFTITVSDYTGHPIPHALILIGNDYTPGSQKDLLETDAQGQVQAPYDWSTPKTITIEAEGFVRTSYLNQLPSGQNFHLHTATTQQNFELRGRTHGHQINNGDNQVDGAMIIPAMTRQELFNFEIAHIISSETDPISVYGQTVGLPSNISIPNQRESYKFIPITLDKPIYRMNFTTGGPRKVFAASVRMPFSQVIDQLRSGSSFTNLINMIELRSAGMADVNLNRPSTDADIFINQISFRKNIQIRAPMFGSNMEMIAVGVSDIGGYLLPTDIKRLQQNEAIQLATVPNKPALTLAILKHKPAAILSPDYTAPIPNEFIPTKPLISGNAQNPKSGQNSEQGQAPEYRQGPGTNRSSEFNQVSVYLDESHSEVAPIFLPLIEPPTVIKLNEIQIPVAQHPPKIIPIATVLSLTITSEKQNPDGKTIRSTKVAWEVYADSWMDEVVLPAWELPFQGNSHRWDVSLIGGKGNWAFTDETKLIDMATHMTRSYTDF